MEDQEQRQLLTEIRDYLIQESNNLTLRKLRSDIVAYSEFNQKIARAFGCDVDKAFGGPCIVTDRYKFEHQDFPLTGSWDGVGDYTQNLNHILKHLIPDDLWITIERRPVKLTPDGVMFAGGKASGPDVMMGGWAGYLSPPQHIAHTSVSMPRALLLLAIDWKLYDLDKDKGPRPA